MLHGKQYHVSPAARYCEMSGEQYFTVHAEQYCSVHCRQIVFIAFLAPLRNAYRASLLNAPQALSYLHVAHKLEMHGMIQHVSQLATVYETWLSLFELFWALRSKRKELILTPLSAFYKKKETRSHKIRYFLQQIKDNTLTFSHTSTIIPRA